ncbi:hypothetical protein NYA22BAC_00299 [Parasphingorhabdus sp. NYA22]
MVVQSLCCMTGAIEAWLNRPVRYKPIIWVMMNDDCNKLEDRF